MQKRNEFAEEIKSKKYIDSYLEKWMKLETLDKPYVECEGCGYASNASIHQRLLVPREYNSGSNKILHLCANCNYELLALIDKFEKTPENITQICEQAFEKLKEKKKHYREMNNSLERIEI